jgi:hypothetical protein
MKANGAEVVHLATGLLVGYPPCPYLTHFHDYIQARSGLEVVYGTHPIPRKYLDMHTRLKTWEAASWQAILEPTLADPATRQAYD